MSSPKQKIIFKGPLAAAMYQTLAEVFKEAESGSLEDIDSSPLSASLVTGENGKRLVVNSQNVSAIVIFGAQGSSLTQEDCADFLALFDGIKNSTEVRLLVRGDDGEFGPILKECAEKLEITLYTSFAQMLGDLVGASK